MMHFAGLDASVKATSVCVDDLQIAVASAFGSQIDEIEEGLSTRKLNVGVFAQPRSTAVNPVSCGNRQQ